MKKFLFSCSLALATLSMFGQEKRWRELEGVFQSPANKEMYVRFTPADSVLVAHLLWNDGELHLLPDTGLAFVSKELDGGNPVRISFQRDPSGAVDRVSVAGNGVWTRVNNYKPTVKTEMAHTPEQLQKYTGLYEVMPDSSEYIEVSVEDNSLSLHWLLNEGKQTGFVPSAEGKFFRKDYQLFTLDFSQDQQGQVTQFVAVGRLRYIRMARSAPSPAQVKTYEGRFRSVDDPDNLLELIADGNGLVLRELWNKKEIRLQPVTSTYFNDDKSSFPVRVISENGRVKQIIVLADEHFDKVSDAY